MKFYFSFPAGGGEWYSFDLDSNRIPKINWGRRRSESWVGRVREQRRPDPFRAGEPDAHLGGGSGEIGRQSGLLVPLQPGENEVPHGLELLMKVRVVPCVRPGRMVKASSGVKDRPRHTPRL